ncbi:MAG: nucleoside triphosphate pyrophosphohydrolase [Firmicutes bacterium HGW-Firmicutes-13]|nr:MAG: nucleoside triphosphate pyrophosphohydrolase [Firmicutes bacterium HGW-Firmicutes-13]
MKKKYEENKNLAENKDYTKNKDYPENKGYEKNNNGLDSALYSLVEVMDKLRAPGGCPWDRKQTHGSLKPYLIEEAYEVIHAINQGDMKALREELGDLLLQIVFHSQLASEEEAFTLQEVIDEIKEKIIRRHPHVFGTETIKDVRSVSLKWSEIKKQEKHREGLFYNPEGLPALKRAQKVQQQAARYGFDWDNIEGAWDKIIEELKELENVYNKGNRDRIEEEVGDLIFAVVNVSRFLEIDAELALSSTVEKFLRRMRFIEERVKEEGKEFYDYNLEQLDKLWDDAKKKGL